MKHALTCVTVAAATIGCSNGTGPTPLDNSIGVIASGLVPPPSATGAFRSAAILPASVVYVSLPPNAVPTGVTATIRNQATNAVVTTAVINGGFDPVSIGATVGDTLGIDLATSTADSGVHAFLVVARRRPPRIVRTNPPTGGRDVPLNATIVVVFSVPIDSAAVSDGSIQLVRGTTPVAGTLRFGDPDELRIEFHPTSLLASETTYRLLGSATIRGVDGAPLDSPLDVSFTTATNGPAAGLVFASVSTGKFYTCGLTPTGAAYCWGDNSGGQLGSGTGLLGSLTPVVVAGGLSFVSLSAGENQACGVATTNAAYCWGNLGYGDAPIDAVTLSACLSKWNCPTPVAVPGGIAFATVSAGAMQRCGITTTGAAYCWGYGWGPLGFTGDTAFSNTPIAVPGGLTFTAVSAGGSDCGVTTAGDTYCWGSGALGDGNGVSATSPAPVKVAGGLSFTTVSAGSSHACGVTTTGAAYCWGANVWGELGDGTTAASAVPVPVAGGHTFATISANVSGDESTCGATTDGAAYCWGADFDAALTYSGGLPPSSTPALIAGNLTFATLTTSLTHRCGVTTSGTAYCWGVNSAGALGNGTTTQSAVPIKVAGQP